MFAEKFSTRKQNMIERVFALGKKENSPRNWYAMLEAASPRALSRASSFACWTTTPTELEHRWKTQESFVKKMQQIRREPETSEIERSIEEYLHFLRMLKEYPNQKLIPSLVVDLIWHTHMLDHEPMSAIRLPILATFSTTTMKHPSQTNR